MEGSKNELSFRKFRAHVHGWGAWKFRVGLFVFLPTKVGQEMAYLVGNFLSNTTVQVPFSNAGKCTKIWFFQSDATEKLPKRPIGARKWNRMKSYVEFPWKWAFFLRCNQRSIGWMKCVSDRIISRFTTRTIKWRIFQEISSWTQRWRSLPRTRRKGSPQTFHFQFQ